MADKVQQIKEEIERIIEEETPISKGSDYYHGAKESMEKLLQFIDSLPEEHNEDLEEELNRWQIYHDYPEEYLDLLNFARHFAEWQKQQMMKDAVEAEVIYPASSSTLQIRYKLPKNTKLKYGDKVKIIIVETN